MKQFKKIILIDLDGVLNTYTGNYNENYIPPISNGAYKFIKEISKNYEVKLFTTRDSTLASKWLKENQLDTFIKKTTNIKEPSYLIIDDRCINFEGDYNKLKEKINNFKPWYK